MRLVHCIKVLYILSLDSKNTLITYLGRYLYALDCDSGEQPDP